MERQPRWAPYLIGVLLSLAVPLVYLTLTSDPSPEHGAMSVPAAASSVSKPSLPSVTCGEISEPPNGRIEVHEPAVMKRSDANYSGIEFINEAPTPVRATLLVPGSEQVLASIFVSAHQRAVLSAPTGRYGLRVVRGSMWCGDAGFRDAVQVTIRDGLATHDGQTGEITIATSPESPAGLAFSFRSKAPAEALTVPAPVLGEGTMEVRADRAGHYRIPGSLNNKPVSFLVDTGASMVSVSRRVANEAGLHECAQWAKVRTANGTVDVCIVRGVTLRFGSFTVSQADIAVLPNLDADALLGMNVLRQFRVEVAQEVLKISAK